MISASRIVGCLLAVALLADLPSPVEAKSYSSGGGRSYSSHSSSSSRSSSSGSSRSSGSSSRSGSGSASRSSGSSSGKSFNSGSGKSYSSGSSKSDSSRKGYSSSKSYTAGGNSSSASAKSRPAGSSISSGKEKSDSGSLSFDSAAARARKEEASKEQFNRFKQSQNPAAAPPNNVPPVAAAPPRTDSRRVYVPDDVTIQTRPSRIYHVFNTYSSYPWVTYRDPYNSFFWWWLLDRSLDDRAWWAYHHRYDMDPVRYQALVANDQQLQARVAQLEAQQVARDPNYVPSGIDRDLMYSDQYVNRAYSNRPTMGGKVAFWVLGVPLVLGFTAFFIWLIWFKRWQTAT
jgi:hypothetical protein